MNQELIDYLTHNSQKPESEYIRPVSVLQTKVSWCVCPRNVFQEIFGVS